LEKPLPDLGLINALGNGDGIELGGSFFFIDKERESERLKSLF
jgi:hypothetical protein